MSLMFEKKTDNLPLSQQELGTLKGKPIPRHLAIIPDGNRRWAKQQCALPEKGHQVGADTLLNIIKAAIQLNIEVLTFYIFSTENWKRPKREIRAQFKLLEKYLIEQKQMMLDNGVRFETIGVLDRFPPHIIELVNETVEATADGDQVTVIFAMNYGGRDEMKRALQAIAADCKAGLLDEEEISESTIGRYLDTSRWSDPDLLIRTSGESRVSNFLLWQLSYTELFFSEVFWPEFSPQHLLEALKSYQSRERRLGGS